MSKEITLNEWIKDFIFYTTPNGNVKIEIFLNERTLWLTQKRMAELFGVSIPTINEHLKNIFSSGELNEISVIRKFRITAEDWKKYNTNFYNLDAIISVWYRVNSSQATQFRIWATQVLREYLIKGFVMDDDRMKNWQHFGKDYFRELLERVRSIRASERRVYQQITDIFAECSIDYDPKSEITKNFYANVQNKFHFAITWKTAAEIVYNSADKAKENMWLQTWKNWPKWRILKSDTIIAKNYLKEDEIKKLERTISAYFDYIERLIENKTSFTMQELSSSVEKFLEFNEYKILDWVWKISHFQAEEKAFLEYDEYNKKQVIDSDFDKFVRKLEERKQI